MQNYLKYNYRYHCRGNIIFKPSNVTIGKTVFHETQSECHIHRTAGAKEIQNCRQRDDVDVVNPTIHDTSFRGFSIVCYNYL
jgi:hypothetical protein